MVFIYMVILAKNVPLKPVITGLRYIFYLFFYFFLFISFSLLEEKTYMHDTSVLNKLITYKIQTVYIKMT